MKLIRKLLFATAMILATFGTMANQADCNGPPMQADECLQSLLDKKIEQVKGALEESIAYVKAAEADGTAKFAGIDVPKVVQQLQISQQLWESFAKQECAAARSFVGNGTDKNRVELQCLINLHNLRLEEIRAWREH